MLDSSPGSSITIAPMRANTSMKAAARAGSKETSRRMAHSASTADDSRRQPHHVGVQRIRHAEIDSQVEGRAIFDGEILTACQAACPAGAIVFGDINDTKSEVKKWKDSPLHYALLADLNTEPRTTYLAALRNPNPELEGA